MREFVLVGNPNAGKSTLFNAMTGQMRKVGNWHGVTTDCAFGKFELDGEKCSLVDLPGLYTVKGSLNEELVAENYLRKRNYDAIIVIGEARALKRTVRLVEELKRFDRPIILFVNFYGEFSRGGGFVSVEKLSRSIGVPVYVGDAVDGNDVDEFKRELSVVATPSKGDGNDEYVKFPERDFKGIWLKPLPAFAFVAATVTAVFYAAFGRYSPATLLSGFINGFLNLHITSFILSVLNGRISPFLLGMISEGIVGGLLSVAAFLPQIAVLTFCLDLLDLSGFLSYASAVTDGLLNKIGLSGRAVYTLVCGYGCTALACSSATSIDDKEVRRRAVLALPFVSCSAKTPVYTFIAVKAFGDYAFIALALVYLLSPMLTALWAFALYKTFLRVPPRPTVTEIARLRIPDLKAALKNLLKNLKQFIIKLGTVILTASVAAYILRSVSVGLEFLHQDRMDESLLAAIGKYAAFAFKPMGITDWRYSVAILSGVFAKEGIASALALLFPSGLNLGVAQAAGLTAFTYAYTPCVTALSAMRKRIGFLSTAVSAVLQFAVALILAYAAYFICSIFV